MLPRSEVSCEAINIQIVADFVTITFYKDEEIQPNDSEGISSVSTDSVYLD